MEGISLISTLAIGFGVALVLGFLAEKLKVPALVGYLLAGILVSPSVFGFDVDLNLANQLAEIGIMLLMFGVGLHFSLTDLLKVKGLVVPGAICQMLLSALIGFGLSWLWGWDIGHSVLLGCCLSCASTVVVLKALEARGMLEGFDGNVAVGWLIVQDMVTVLLLVLLPPMASVFTGQAQTSSQPLWQLLLITLAQVVVFIVLMLVVGRRLLPYLLWQVAKTGSRELFTLCVLAVAIGIAFGAAEVFHVSFALGAFFAGMVMRESKYAHRAAVESLPLRDAFSVIFFVGVGMMFNPMVIVEHPWHLLCVLLLILFINPIIAALLVMLFRYPLHTALTLGACLGQIGEFSFILASLGKSMGIVSDEGMNLVLATAILTIALNPIAFATLPKVAEFLKKRSKLARISAARPDPQSLMPDEIEKKKITGHIVIVGYGDVGCKLTAALQKDEIMSVANKIKEITGYTSFLFRPPYGDYNSTLIDTVYGCNFYPIEWDVDSLDWKDYGTDNIIKTVTTHKALKNGSIILMHNGAKYTAEALESVITGLQSQGYEIVPVSQLINTENFHMDGTGLQIPD